MCLNVLWITAPVELPPLPVSETRDHYHTTITITSQSTNDSKTDVNNAADIHHGDYLLASAANQSSPPHLTYPGVQLCSHLVYLSITSTAPPLKHLPCCVPPPLQLRSHSRAKWRQPAATVVCYPPTARTSFTRPRTLWRGVPNQSGAPLQVTCSASLSMLANAFFMRWCTWWRQDSSLMGVRCVEGVSCVYTSRKLRSRQISNRDQQSSNCDTGFNLCEKEKNASNISHVLKSEFFPKHRILIVSQDSSTLLVERKLFRW